MRVAVIDLGTNTFNLLIAQVFDDHFDVLFNTKEGVALGMGGINEGYISDEALERAFAAFETFSKYCLEYQVDQTVAIGTSALRDATNQTFFCTEVHARFGIDVEIVSGLEEAKLIYQGISWSYDFNKTSLIMDIGGGSTEFIRVSNRDVLEFKSENIGISRAYQLFQIANPLSPKNKIDLLRWFEKNAPGLNSLESSEVLVGASGTFETFYEMVHEKSFPTGEQVIVKVLKDELIEMLDWIIGSTVEERNKHPHIIAIRRMMAPIAALKTKWVIEKMGIQEIVISHYSLKEGVLRRFV